MSNNNIIIAIIVVLVLAIGGYFLFAHTAAAPTVPIATTATTTTDVTATTTTADTGKIMTVTYTNSGFSPATFNVSVGTTVHFVNNSSHGMWVAVGNHPTHTLYDGTTQQEHCTAGTNNNGSFDECAAINPGSVYAFTFTKAGTFPFHNHMSQSDQGTVTVTQQ